MTLRLVALMSVVLLLSLASFGLMMGHYQDRVMEEVARTASEVGRATLKTLETHSQWSAGADGPALPAEVRSGVSGFAWSTGGTAVQPEGEASDEVEVRLERIDPGLLRVWRHRTTGAATDGGEQGSVTDVTAVAVICESDGESTGGSFSEEDCLSLSGPEALELENRFFIDVDTVRTEADLREGLVLRIDTLRPQSTEDVTVLDRLDAHAPPAFVFKRHEDIRLPIPVEEYESLFDRLRRRSLWMFLGVFAVGSVLTAGLASRFTRPIRRLDSGIRELSAGNLDVQVPARGNDEIARLGRAFNEMTRSLRANRQRAREMLRREKHSALGRLAAGVAHDIRNPLHSIGLTLQHLGDTCRPDTPGKCAEFDDSLEIIRGEIRRLDQIVGNFLRFAKSEERPRQTIALNELVTETAHLVRKEAEWRKVVVTCSTDEADPRIVGDGEALRSSLLNLVINGFEAMPEGGKLRLAVESRDGRAVIEVTDDGDGVPPEDRERVFDFAYTTKDGGNGLGLAMVYQCIVEDHGGQVTLEAPREGGTRVRMSLPLGNAREGAA